MALNNPVILDASIFCTEKKYVALFENKLEISEYFMSLYVALMCVVIHHEEQYCLCITF